MRKAAQERFKKADTLMGILKDAGVDPPEQVPAPKEKTPESKGPETSGNGNLWQEVKAVFTQPGQAKAFFRFLRNGLRS